MIYSGYSLQDQHTLQDYGITTDSTIMINLRLRGRCARTSSKSIGSFKDTIRGKDKAQANTTTLPQLPGPYIVEQKSENPALTIAMPEVNNLYTYLYSKSVICRFNGFWPKSGMLHQWIYDALSQTMKYTYAPKDSL